MTSNMTSNGSVFRYFSPFSFLFLPFSIGKVLPLKIIFSASFHNKTWRIHSFQFSTEVWMFLFDPHFPNSEFESTIFGGSVREGPRNRKTARNFSKNRNTTQKWTKPRTVGMLGSEKPHQIFGKTEKPQTSDTPPPYMSDFAFLFICHDKGEGLKFTLIYYRTEIVQ